MPIGRHTADLFLRSTDEEQAVELYPHVIGTDGKAAAIQQFFELCGRERDRLHVALRLDELWKFAGIATGQPEASLILDDNQAVSETAL